MNLHKIRKFIWSEQKMTDHMYNRIQRVGVWVVSFALVAAMFGMVMAALTSSN